MGLLSSRTFRQIATGALTGIEERREEMRDRIDTYRERAVNKKNEIQKKYNEYYNEEKENIQTFKNISTLIGDNYTGQLNSFVMSGGDLNALAQLDSNSIVDKLSGQKVDESQGLYLDKVAEDVKLKREELNQNLQDQVGLFKGTSSLFTRDIEERGMKDIQTEVGEIDAKEPLDTKFSAGKSIDITELRPDDRITAQKLLNSLYGDEDSPTGFNEETIAPLRNQAEIMIENGYQGTELEALEELIFKQQYSNYNGTALDFLTDLSQNDPKIIELAKPFDGVNSETANLDELQNIVNQIAPLNKFVAEDYQTIINEIKAEREGKDTVDATVTVEDADNIPGTKKVGAGSRMEIVTEDYLTDADKEANSKKQVSEEFIKQVMDKNNVDRNGAIEILQRYGYTQFPQAPKPEKKGPPFLGGGNK